jgi:UDP-N-acetylmuramyl tripeptide synthase
MTDGPRAEHQRLTGPGRLPIRTRLALAAGRSASALSQRLGRGRGAVIGGAVTLALDPAVLPRLARGRSTALVSATNGKSTTTGLLAAAVRTLGPVAFNELGANMDTGLVASLDRDRRAPYAVLEVDEAYLGPLSAATRPRCITLLNLSRDYLERGVRAKKMARHWRETTEAIDWPCTVVASADDPLVAWAVRHAPDVVWVAGGQWWPDDGALCRDCLVALTWEGDRWRCERCRFGRPEPAWWLDGHTAVGPDVRVELEMRLPGRAAESNALFALASAVVMGADPATAAAAISSVSDAAGRFGAREFEGRQVHLLMAKNPASWTETVDLVRHREGAVIFAVDGRGVGGKDTALIWDAPIELLAGRSIISTGERRHDIALRLDVAGVQVEVVEDPLEAVRRVPPGPVYIAANYPAFLLILDRLEGRK